MFCFCAIPASAAEPNIVNYTCTPIFQTEAVDPNIVMLLDNGAEMEQIIWHSGYNNSIGYTPTIVAPATQKDVVPGPGGNGFFNGNGYSINKQGNKYQLVKVLSDLTLDNSGLTADSSDATLQKGTWIINGRTVTLPAVPSTAVDGSGIKDNATSFRYSKNYLNWIFFSTGSGSYVDVSSVDNGTDLPAKTRFYYAKKAIMDVALSAANKAFFGVWNFTSTTQGASSVQPLKKVVGADNKLDSAFVNNINNMGTVTYSPLAEGLARIGGYYNSPASQTEPASVLYDCQDSFVIVVSPGVSSEDQGYATQSSPDSLSDYDGDGRDVAKTLTIDGITYTIPTNQNGSTYLDDVAHYLYTHDIVGYRNGFQNVSTYTVGFMSDNISKLFLINTSNNGNGNLNLYNTTDSKYGKYHFAAENPDNLAPAILAAVNDILQRAASGTAVSVLATSGEGEGNLIQAYFRPTIPSGEAEVKWIGYLQSLWVDAYGNLREDTNANQTLDIATDKIVTYFVDSETGDTMIKRFAVSADIPYPDLKSTSSASEVRALDGIDPLWEAGKVLHLRSANNRKIFTYIDKNKDGVVDESTYNNYDSSGEVVKFDIDSATSIKPYLGVKDDTAWGYLAGTLANTHDNRVTNLINYIRGNNITGLRPRIISGNAWKLGDIINSTPVAISKPTDNYHIIYGDKSYQTYYNTFKGRETVVYVGANDGMLHAFTSWQYDATTKKYTQPGGTSENIGDELWAFIPQCQLPHLKWLADPRYGHVYYVDLKPKIFDAKILPKNTHYTDSDSNLNWGTFLLVGMNMGGKYIWAAGDFDNGSGGTVTETRNFYPSYVCMDVTDPRNPKLLWERTYTDLELTTSFPAIVRVKDKWFAVFGSGPSATAGNCDGTSTQKGHIFVVDLATGNPYRSGTNDWRFETNESNAFMNSPVSIDKGLNYNVDAIYFGEAYLDTTWKGKLYKVTIPWATGSLNNLNYDGINLTNYSDDPNDGSKPWQVSMLFDATRPVTGPLALSVDFNENVWIYGGTGRYLSQADKTSTDTQYFFGIKDPFFNKIYAASPAYYHSYSSTKSLTHANLLDADGIVITDAGLVFKNGNPYPSGTSGTFQELLTVARGQDGWKRAMTGGERIVNKPTLLGGIVFAPSFVPNSDPCGFGGNSYLWGVYFETGTAYYKQIFSDEPTVSYADYKQVVDKISLGAGKSSSLGVHVGSEGGAKGFIQQSTGSIVSENINPAFNIKSGLKSWQEK